MTQVQIRAVAWDDSASQGSAVHQMTPAHMKPTDSKIPLFVLKLFVSFIQKKYAASCTNKIVGQTVNSAHALSFVN